MGITLCICDSVCNFFNFLPELSSRMLSVLEVSTRCFYLAGCPSLEVDWIGSSSLSPLVVLRYCYCYDFKEFFIEFCFLFCIVFYLVVLFELGLGMKAPVLL